MIKSKICDLLGIKYPIFQGGMAWISDASLAAAVSEAGGLGIISAMNANADYVRDQIRKCKALTDKPFGVNIMLMSPFADEVAKVVLEEKVAVVTTGAGMPTKYIKDWLAAGIKVIPVAGAVAFAVRLARMGATAVIAEGCESGGHVGEMNTMALVPQVCDAVDIPVIAAGGIGDGRGLAAAFMLGAEGVQCGTCFLVADECNVHENYKKKIIAAGDSDTIVTGKRLGHPVRSLKNHFSRQFAEMEKNNANTDEQIMAFGAGSLRKAAVDGNETDGSFMAGQIAGMVKKEEPAKAIVENMVKQAEEILSKTSNLVY
ncbi:MAG: enoyl-[acyl-carrier-protein] reductase FabK [Bacteroidales bacterium]|nr:enoyl-[acyl-carrier-protein] reductase FabK [Bacteroidales bacterium]MBP5134385.1 enoyl-[acyl-carrier-protein] reductase FabK [Paludibacteraceae bacterium]MDD6356582.1 enoyl-[acyl-carrier-protein] reductase FabK [Bacteroidales bacterium]